jgi:hypothetical protein
MADKYKAIRIGNDSNGYSEKGYAEFSASPQVIKVENDKIKSFFYIINCGDNQVETKTMFAGAPKAEKKAKAKSYNIFEGCTTICDFARAQGIKTIVV